MVAQLLQLTWQQALGSLSGAMKWVHLCFSNYKKAMQNWLQHRCATYIFAGLKNIYMINPSSTDTCKPITSYCEVSHYLSGVELSGVATSNLLFKIWAVLHLGAPGCTLALIHPLARPGMWMDPVISTQLPTAVRPCRTVPVSEAWPVLESPSPPRSDSLMGAPLAAFWQWLFVFMSYHSTLFLLITHHGKEVFIRALKHIYNW